MFTETSLDASEMVGSVEAAARATDVLVSFEDSELSAPLIGPGANGSVEENAGMHCQLSDCQPTMTSTKINISLPLAELLLQCWH